MSDWGTESEDLFRAARRDLSPQAGERDRVRAMLAMKLGAGAVAAGASLTATASSAAGKAASGGSAAAIKGSGVPLLAKIVAPLAIAGAIGTAAVAPRMIAAHAQQQQEPTPAMTAAPIAIPASKAARAVAPVEEPPPAVSISVSDLPSVKDPRAKSPHAPADVPSNVDREEEAKLVTEIDAALRAGDVMRASRLADEHERRFPHGLLVEERDGARAIARCSSSPRKAIADAFLRAHPRSPMRARVLAACGQDESSGER